MSKKPSLQSLVRQRRVKRGELRFLDGLRNHGEVRGDAQVKAALGSLLVIGENSRVYVKVKVEHVIIAAKAADAVYFEDRERQSTARPVGDVCC